MRRFGALLLALALLAPACAPAAQERGLLVFAAASLSDLMPRLGERFQERTGIRVEFHFAGSSSLVTQVTKGSPADVLVLAGRGPVRALQDRVAWTVDVATNRLVLAARSEYARTHRTGWPRSLCGGGVERVALADPTIAPAGRYGQQSLEKLGLWECLQPKLVPALDVRAALALARTGAADVAVVYSTDAGSYPGIEVLAVLPDDSHEPILYPAVLLKGALHEAEGRSFVEFLQSEEAREAFERAGFRTPGSQASGRPRPAAPGPVGSGQ